MKITFGPNQPNETQSVLLQRLGFDLDRIKLEGKYYFLDLPKTPRIKYEKNMAATNIINSSVTYNGVEVISICQNTAYYNSYVYFRINESAVEEALAMNEEISEDDMRQANKEPKLSKYQKKLTDRLFLLVYVFFREGADRGYGACIRGQFPYLLALKEENPEEYQQLIGSNEQYKQLEEMFPNWTDPKNLLREYENRQIGFFTDQATSPRDGSAPACNIM